MISEFKETGEFTVLQRKIMEIDSNEIAEEDALAVVERASSSLFLTSSRRCRVLMLYIYSLYLIMLLYEVVLRLISFLVPFSRKKFLRVLKKFPLRIPVTANFCSNRSLFPYKSESFQELPYPREMIVTSRNPSSNGTASSNFEKFSDNLASLFSTLESL